MPTPIWQPGRLYPPGSLVQPATAIEPIVTSLDNPGFDDGTDGGWTFSGAGVHAVTTLNSHSGTYNLACDNGEVIGQNNENPPANPGLTITASVQVRLSQSGTSAGRVRLWWLDGGGATIGAPVDGNLVQKPGSRSERWVQSTVNATAPVGTASVKIGFWSNSGVGGGDTRIDSLAWNYTSASAPAGLIYKAVQPVTGYSDDVEPVWPLTNGVQVVDNEVTWEAIFANRVIWEASPIMLSGAVEPLWPTTVGERITDGTISWEVISRRVEDENCPNSKVVAIMAGKVFAGDRDIVRFSATANPLDWTTPDDAGYLPTGLQQANANDVEVLAPYRSNLCPFNASSFQNWQVDPDPAAMAILDQMEGIGSSWQHAAQPVGNELFYLSQRGVRTVGIAAGAENLAAGDVGMPIDPLVQAVMDGTVRPLATYYPSMGQYWLAMRAALPVVQGPAISGDAPNGDVGEAWGPYAYTVTPGDAPIANVYISDGSLPPGFAISALGVVTVSGGSPSVGGFYEFEVTVIDENGLTATVPDSIALIGVFLALPSDSVPFLVNRETVRRGGAGGTDWSLTPIAHGGTENYSNIAVRSGEILLTIGAVDDFSFSDDSGATWSQGNFPVAPTGGKAIRTDSYWFVSGGSGVEAFRSPVGATLTFTQPDATVQAQMYALVQVGTRLVGVTPFGDPNNVTVSDDDGDTWDWVSTGIAGGVGISAIDTDGELLVMACKLTATADTVIRWSDDAGDTWTQATSPFTTGAGTARPQMRYCASLERWIAASHSGELAYSLDGKTAWTLATDAMGVGVLVNGLTSSGGIIMGACNDGTLIRSTDGITYTNVIPSDQPAQMFDIAVLE